MSPAFPHFAANPPRACLEAKMSQEIEIKFCLNRAGSETLSTFLPRLPIVSRSCYELGNSYFDTPDLALRRLDMGLRIRRWGEEAEQTIKCRGQVLGGLHARPEYNTPIEGERPDLSRFPRDIWPDEETVAWLQANLHPLFRTDFRREALQLAQSGVAIELARDEGEIVGRLGREPIDELELELKSGPASALFDLAERLAALGGLRPGHLSKAQRGYRLAGQAAPWALRSERPAVDDLAGLMEDMQLHEACWLAGVAGAAERMGEDARLLLAQAEGRHWRAPLASWWRHWEAAPEEALLYGSDYALFLLRLTRQLHGA